MTKHGGRHLLYLLGVPGVGKSTLMARLVQGKRRRVRLDPFAHTVYEDGLVQLGRERADFSGTDSLSMSVMPKAIAALEAGAWPRIVAEGDRLASAKYFQAAEDAGYSLVVVLLEAPEEVCAERRAERGSAQDPSWMAGRRTKVARLAEWVTLWLDAREPVELLAEQLAGQPVFRTEG